MRLYLLTFVMVLFTAQLHAGALDTLSIGIGGGYESYKTFKGEIYLKSNFDLFNRKAELKAGVNNRSYNLEFDNVKDLSAKSVGFFGDITIYPFNKGLFTGIRWELINFNWLTAGSRTKIENERNYSATLLYSGTCMFFQLGYDFKISDKAGIKIYGQPGIQQFKISNGSSTAQNTSNDNVIMEDHYKFIYNINLSIEFKIK
jgi:hypothetical protein